jgi:transposase
VDKMKKMEAGLFGRRCSLSQKARILAACEVPGASIASVARAHGVKASLVHNWRYAAKVKAAKVKASKSNVAMASVPTRQGEFLPVALSTPSSDVAHAAGTAIRVELRRGATTVHVQWPLAASTACGAWLRELLG